MDYQIIKHSPSLDTAVRAWLHEKAGKSGSAETEKAYRTAIAAFRAFLQAQGIDLDGDTKAVAASAQVWAALSRRREVSPATYNQRLAIVSSFYEYVLRHECVVAIQANPIRRVGRRDVQAYAGAQPLSQQQVRDGLSRIDRTTLRGKRDYALILLAHLTGRRLSELVHLCWEDFDEEGVVTFKHAKGGKVMRDRLPQTAIQALREYHEALPQPRMSHVWLHFSNNVPVGPMSGNMVGRLYLKYFGTSKVHTTRHTWAHAMEQAGAKVSTIQQRLGHSSLETTGRYLAALASSDNPYSDVLAEMYTGV